MRLTEMGRAMAQIAETFTLAPFETALQPLIEQVLKQLGKHQYRKGTILKPRFLVWLVLALTLRRDLSYDRLLNWVVSGFRWVRPKLPAGGQVLSDGTLSHARLRLGFEVFRELFVQHVASFPSWKADFYGYRSVAFDGTTATMPDTESNMLEFDKPSSRKGSSAFPQLRLMSLLAIATHHVLDVDFAPYSGKGTGERTLVCTILKRLKRSSGFMFLMDAGLYAFDILWTIHHQDAHFLVKVPSNVKPKHKQRLKDGSWMAQITQKVIDTTASPNPSGRNRWTTRQLEVRLVCVLIPGFRPFRLMTNLIDYSITARDLAIHYHQRWDIEIAYDEIKTHQCATLRGQSPTTFRSKKQQLVKQELYAMLIMYNAIRQLICLAVAPQLQDPRHISFLQVLQHLIDATPSMSAQHSDERESSRAYLMEVLADCSLERPRRPRCHPRVVKVKMSKFRRKNATHTSQNRDLEKELRIIDLDAIGVAA